MGFFTVEFPDEARITFPANSQTSERRLLLRQAATITTTSNNSDQTAVVASYATEFTPNIEFAIPNNGTNYAGVVFYATFKPIGNLNGCITKTAAYRYVTGTQATFFFGANNLIDRPPNTNQRCRYTLTIRPTTTPPTPALTHTPTTLDATTGTTTANLTATTNP